MQCLSKDRKQRGYKTALQKPKFYLIAEIALPDAEYIIVNYFVDSLLSRLFHLYALLVCVEYV